jgi:hypothetical protein
MVKWKSIQPKQTITTITTVLIIPSLQSQHQHPSPKNQLPIAKKNMFLKVQGPKRPGPPPSSTTDPGLSGPTARQALPKSEGLKAPLPWTKIHQTLSHGLMELMDGWMDGWIL